MKTLILTSLLFCITNIMAQEHEWIELRYSVSAAAKYQIIVVGNFKPYGLETDEGEKIKNIPMAIELMEERGFKYIEAYSITADPGLGITLYYTCILMKKQTGVTGSEPILKGKIPSRFYQSSITPINSIK